MTCTTTGFSFDDYGELGVISVTVGQIGYPAFILIDLLSSLLTYLTDEKSRGEELMTSWNLI